MAFDPDDFEKLLNKRKTEKAGETRTNLTAIQQAAIKADAMTGDPAWDTFLTYLQTNVNDNIAARDALLRDLSSPTLVNPDQIMGRRIALIQTNERIMVLEHVISMPAKIKKLGEAAITQLKAIDASPEAAE